MIGIATGDGPVEVQKTLEFSMIKAFRRLASRDINRTEDDLKMLEDNLKVGIIEG